MATLLPTPSGSKSSLQSRRLETPSFRPKTFDLTTGDLQDFKQKDVKVRTIPSPSALPGVVSALQGGLQAGQSVVPGPDLTSNIVGVGGATVGGALSGALTGAAIGAAGGPIGALGGAIIGGSAALIASGLNAWLSTRNRNKEQARQDALLKQIQQKQDEAARIARTDSLRRESRQVKEFNLKKNWAIAQSEQKSLFDFINKSDDLRERFLQRGFV